MRIVAGEFGGRKLFCPRTLMIRPTSDRMRESLFSILGDRCVDSEVLDLFAGVGTLGLEALSRGARHATFVEYSHQALSYLKKNIEFCRERAEVIPVNAGQSIRVLSKKGKKYHLIFLDPPYERGFIHSALQNLSESAILGSPLWVIAQHSKREPVEEQWENFKIEDKRTYGETVMTILRGES